MVGAGRFVVQQGAGAGVLGVGLAGDGVLEGGEVGLVVGVGLLQGEGGRGWRWWG